MTKAEQKAINAILDKVIRYLKRRGWDGMAADIRRMKDHGTLDKARKGNAPPSR